MSPSILSVQQLLLFLVARKKEWTKIAISALWYLGQKNVSFQTFEIIEQKLGEQKFKKLTDEAIYMSGWMAKVLYKYCRSASRKTQRLERHEKINEATGYLDVMLSGPKETCSADVSLMPNRMMG